ncbi:MAG: FtsX-like permease family protein [Bacteroidetes bacterium]|nr:MAG: FtsX-like permease family protein [Bacteroidota bacterium]
MKTIMNIFLAEGVLISLLGGIVGLMAGLAVCYIHLKFGLVRLSGTIVEYYPVKIRPGDVVLIILTIVVIGIFTSYLPSRIVVKKAY